MGRAGQKTSTGSARRNERADARLGRFGRDGTIEVGLAGRRVVVEGGIPTETVRLELSGKGNHWRGEVLAVLDPAAERVAPACPVIDRCGGCEWQHLSHAGQLKHKAAITRRILAAQRLPARIDALVPMPDPWHYRVRAQIALGAQAGFRERRAKRIVPLATCPVVHPLLARLLEQANRLLRLGQIPDFGGRVLLHAQVAGPEQARGLQLLLEGVDGLRLEEALIRHTAEALGGQRGVMSVSWLTPAGEVTELIGSRFAEVEVGGRAYTIPAGSFFQSNLQLLPRLLSHLGDLLELDGGEAVADLYGGVGLLGLSVADRVRTLRVIEIDPLASEAGRRTAACWGLEHAAFVAAPAAEAVAELPALDRVIVDPPRTGLDRRVIDALIERLVPVVAYVSCNPATFARDAAAFVRAGYRIEHLSLWDFYPHTVHTEVVAKLVAEAGETSRPPS